MIEVEQEDWDEEVLDDAINIRFKNLIANEEADLLCL